mmetsp:Transcript_24922/g.44863  ORF Transcript_24922/g.44863 Transcript_24922/m.44863 type:complete len:151 (-) Transcript_24922:256-708(-)
MNYYERLILKFDGASRNNPHGPAGCGWVLYEMDECGADSYNSIASGCEYLGFSVSNNQAEYAGLIDGLNYLVNNNISCDKLYVRGDAEIVIRQMEGEYNVNSYNIKPYYNDAQDALNQIDCTSFNFRHFSRDKNWEADQLANEAIQNNGY